MNRVDIRVTGQPECDAFVAAGDIAFETGTVYIVGTTLVGEDRLFPSVPADENTIMVLRILVQQAGINKSADNLLRDSPFHEVGKDSAVIGARCGKGERLLGRFGRRVMSTF